LLQVFTLKKSKKKLWGKERNYSQPFSRKWLWSLSCTCIWTRLFSISLWVGRRGCSFLSKMCSVYLVVPQRSQHRG